MSTNKKTDAPKQQPKSSVPDALIKTSNKGNVELTEEEMKRVSGGCGAGMSKILTS
jgi:hypothetical protein